MTIRLSVVAGFVLLVIASQAPVQGSEPDRRKNYQQVERTMAADPRVLVSACVVSGDLTVRGWNRNEVRARVTDGTQIELTRNDQIKSQAATELRVTTNGQRRPGSNSSCIPSADIELDVPGGAAVRLQTSSGDIFVTDVARVEASSQSGGMTLAKVAVDTSLNTISGEISVRDSAGSFKLHTVGGEISARNLLTAGLGGGFEASTVSGEVTLDQVQIPTIKVNTVSGDVDWTGPLSRAGRYDLQSISGRMRLVLPNNASFRLSASFGQTVRFSSDFNLNYSENQSTAGGSNRGGFRQFVATAGNGDSLITVSLLEGSLQIHKR